MTDVLIRAMIDAIDVVHYLSSYTHSEVKPSDYTFYRYIQPALRMKKKDGRLGKRFQIDLLFTQFVLMDAGV